MEKLNYKIVHGKEIIPYLEDMGKLRICVFWEYPYLYEGNLAYEKDYFKEYTENENSIVIMLFDDTKMIGLSTGLPLSGVSENFQNQFKNVGLNPEEIYYFGESILLPDYRGKGYGNLFFDLREKQANKLTYPYTLFCSVIRPENHPLKPANYRPNDVFWKKRGYEKLINQTCQMKWLDRGEKEETFKELVFWRKSWK